MDGIFHELRRTIVSNTVIHKTRSSDIRGAAAITKARFRATKQISTSRHIDTNFLVDDLDGNQVI